MLNFRLARPSALVDLSELGLDGIRLEDGALVVGAMTRQWDLEHHAGRVPASARRPPPRRPHGDALPRARSAARSSTPTRPPSCPCARSRSERSCARTVATIPAEEFFVSVFTTALEPGELLTEIRFPEPAGETSFREVAHRDGDFAVVCVARNGDRVAVGGVAATPVLWRRRRRPDRRPVRPGGLQAGDRGEAGREMNVVVNGIAYERAVEPRLLLSDFIRHELQPLRHARRLRARRLRRLHGAARRPPGALVPDPRRPGGRPRRSRRSSRWRTAPSSTRSSRPSTRTSASSAASARRAS